MPRIEAELLAQANGLIAKGTSAANAAQTVTVAAPGAGKRNHLTGVVAIYDDASDHAITITVNAVALVLNTGTGVNGLTFTGVDFQGAVNATVTVGAVAGGVGVVSDVYAFYYVESGV